MSITLLYYTLNICYGMLLYDNTFLYLLFYIISSCIVYCILIYVIIWNMILCYISYHKGIVLSYMG